MKQLYLIRHAKSSWADSTLADRDRPLNKRGLRDAPFMAARLKHYGVMPEHIYTSPAVRAETTAVIIAKTIGYPLKDIERRPEIYTSNLSDLLTLVRSTPKSMKSLFLFGHNYVITDFAEYLSGESLLNIPTCGIVSISFDIRKWKDLGEKGGRMEFFDYPKKHRTKR